ncbi:MAG TPA: hypothetical protein DD381_03390 [Lentisphaeria bacterium]|nr:MAG: hypothetical protein A2X47_02860 [Lentisphaerae bacterium GWF2_38_69]HBM15376.1 hypothetical protein [Lentisphaeria bacterium]
MKKIIVMFFSILITIAVYADGLNVPVTALTGCQNIIHSGSKTFGYFTNFSNRAYIASFNYQTKKWDKIMNIPDYLSSNLVFFELAKDSKGQLDQSKAIIVIQSVENLDVIGINLTNDTTSQLASLPYSSGIDEDPEEGIEPEITMGNGLLFVYLGYDGSPTGWIVDYEPFLADSTKTDDSPKDSIAKIPNSEV